MKQENLNDYIAEFQSLANKAGYTLDEEATLKVFQNGLPNPLIVNIIKFHHPVTWNEWTSAARIQHQEYVLLKDIMNKSEGETLRGNQRTMAEGFQSPQGSKCHGHRADQS